MASIDGAAGAISGEGLAECFGAGHVWRKEPITLGVRDAIDAGEVLVAADTGDAGDTTAECHFVPVAGAVVLGDVVGAGVTDAAGAEAREGQAGGFSTGLVGREDADAGGAFFGDGVGAAEIRQAAGSRGAVDTRAIGPGVEDSGAFLGDGVFTGAIGAAGARGAVDVFAAQPGVPGAVALGFGGDGAGAIKAAGTGDAGDITAECHLVPIAIAVGLGDVVGAGVTGAAGAEAGGGCAGDFAAGEVLVEGAIALGAGDPIDAGQVRQAAGACDAFGITAEGGVVPVADAVAFGHVVGAGRADAAGAEAWIGLALHVITGDIGGEGAGAFLRGGFQAGEIAVAAGTDVAETGAAVRV